MATPLISGAAATRARTFQLSCRAKAASAASAAAAATATNAAASPRILDLHQHQHQQPQQQQQRRTASSSSSSAGGGRDGRNKEPSRRSITITSDDGRYAWSELTTGEKAARSTQQTFNFLLVGAGITGVCVVSYFLYEELLAPDSKTVQFNKAVNRVKASPECRELLGGPSRKIVAFGGQPLPLSASPTAAAAAATTTTGGGSGGNTWAKSRPIAHTVEVSKTTGTTYFRMHFNVQGTKANGVVTVHMSKPADRSNLEYDLLSLTVPGHETVYLENREAANKGIKGRGGKMFGVQWR